MDFGSIGEFGQFGITGEGVLHIHCHKIEQFVGIKLREEFGVGAIGVEFEFETQGADFFDNFWQISMQSGFSSGDDDAV